MALGVSDRPNNSRRFSPWKIAKRSIAWIATHPFETMTFLWPVVLVDTAMSVLNVLYLRDHLQLATSLTYPYQFKEDVSLVEMVEFAALSVFGAPLLVGLTRAIAYGEQANHRLWHWRLGSREIQATITDLVALVSMFAVIYLLALGNPSVVITIASVLFLLIGFVFLNCAFAAISLDVHRWLGASWQLVRSFPFRLIALTAASLLPLAGFSFGDLYLAGFPDDANAALTEEGSDVPPVGIAWDLQPSYTQLVLGAMVQSLATWILTAPLYASFAIVLRDYRTEGR